MNKKELAEAIASAHESSHKEAEEIVNTLFSAMQESLSKGNEVAISGFGAFKVKERAARTGRNPKTGESIQIAAKKVVNFKAGKQLADEVNV